jgi:hypothetical protein
MAEKDYPQPESMELVFDKKYGKIYLVPEYGAMICVLTQDYVPIEKFQKVFNAMAELVPVHGIKKFIFDKRHLRAFHQPSMEWYFVDWKQRMYEHGLSVHRKILPKGETWFKDAVDAGRARILQAHPGLDLGKYDIAYRDSVQEALES